MSLCPALALGADQAAAARLDYAHGQLLTARNTANPQICRDLAQEFLRDRPQQWTMMALRVWDGVSTCEAQPGGSWATRPPTAAQLRAAYAPAFDHFARMPLDQRLKNDLLVDVYVLYWRLLRQYDHAGSAAVADAEEAATLGDWYGRAARQPPDDLAVASLTRLGPAVYGMRWLAAWMERQQLRLEQTLGPGHPATLHMMRSRIFAFRQHERPADALALSDEYAARVERYQPSQGPRLAMLNRSERIGALAALGRHADAVDEGRLLLDWLLQQKPPSLGNIMRTAYNLAGAALEMGDAETAEAMARLSREHGLRSDSHDRGESIVAERLIHQARLLRGDESAGPDLKAVVQGISSYDLGGIESVHALYLWARRQGDVDTERWAARTIDEVTHFHASPLQPAHALPLQLQAEREPAGSEQGLQAAAEAVAHGLAGDAAVAEVRPLLELSRHVQARQPDGAAWLCKRAAQDLLDWRRLLPKPQEGQPRLWLAEHEAELRRCIGLFIDLGRLGEAEQVLGVLREEELNEFRRRSRGPQRRDRTLPSLGFTPDEQQRDARLQPLRQHLRQEALAARTRADTNPDQRRRHGGTDAQAEAVLTGARRELVAVSLQPPAAARQALHAAVPPTSALPRGHVRVTYAMNAGPNGEAWALVDTGHAHRRINLPAGPAQLARAVAELRAQIAGSGETVPPAARQLHRWLIEPLRPALTGVRHLHIVPDGVLRYLPFAALHDGQRFLVEAFSLNLALSANVPHQPVPPATRQAAVAAFGNSQPSATHSALPGVRDELAALDRLPPARVQRALDGAFTRDSLQQALQRQPQVVHLASHFVLTPASEEDSYLLLGDGQRLSLRELRQLPWQGVRVALLSACDSALPLDQDATAQGREWAGFAAALQRAGVPEVMATLWRIDDDNAARWMGGFYERWAQRGRQAVPDAEVLASTQRQWLKRHRNSPRSHPRHWAGFVWIGR